jgi:hypothetical protein
MNSDRVVRIEQTPLIGFDLADVVFDILEVVINVGRGAQFA